MPPFEITLFYKPMIKPKLVEAIKKSVTTVLDNEAVIIDLQSLGYRDLPMKKVLRDPAATNKSVWACNSILLKTSMPQTSMVKIREALLVDNDLIRYGIVNLEHMESQPEVCDLDEYLKPPAYRESVDRLRKSQKMSHMATLRIYKRTERAWRNIPKSYWISPALK